MIWDPSNLDRILAAKAAHEAAKDESDTASTSHRLNGKSYEQCTKEEIWAALYRHITWRTWRRDKEIILTDAAAAGQAAAEKVWCDRRLSRDEKVHQIFTYVAVAAAVPIVIAGLGALWRLAAWVVLS